MTRTRAIAAAAVLCCLLVLLAGCGSGGSKSSSASSSTASSPSSQAKTPIDVEAATTLQPAFDEYAKSLTAIEPHFTYDGSGSIALRIEGGATPDVFASSNPNLPAYLYGKGLVEKPVPFATNKLVLVVRKHSPIVTVADAGEPELKLAIAIGAALAGPYAEAAIKRLPPAEQHAIKGNIYVKLKTAEEVLAAVKRGTVAGGFVFNSDVVSGGSSLRAVEFPAAASVSVSYDAAVIKEAKHPQQAHEFIEGLRTGAGRAALIRAGYVPVKE